MIGNCADDAAERLWVLIGFMTFFEARSNDIWAKNFNLFPRVPQFSFFTFAVIFFFRTAKKKAEWLMPVFVQGYVLILIEE